MANIPLEIWGEVFLRSPAISLLRLRSVCNSWRQIIDDPSFVRSHTNNQLSSNTILMHNSNAPPFYNSLYSLDLETVNSTDSFQTITATPINFSHRGLPKLPHIPVTACNGLMLVSLDYGKTGQIWNSLTNERLELPKRDFYSSHPSRGLGYDYATDDYKVVMIDCLRSGHSKKHVNETHIYSLKFDSWKKIGNFPCDDWYVSDYDVCFFLSGALHWIYWREDMIIALDLGTEKYSQFKFPLIIKRVNRGRYINVLGGCFILCDYCMESNDIDVWVMKDYGVKDSWIKLFSLEQQTFLEYEVWSLRPVAYMKNKMHVLLQDREGFYSFDVVHNSVKPVSIHGIYNSLYAKSFQGSIFRLQENCGVSKSVTTERTEKNKEEDG